MDAQASRATVTAYSPDVGVERGVEDALLGDLAAEHEAVDPALTQEVVE